MAELNKANRQTCDVDIRVAKTKAPFLDFKTANTTTAGLTADTTFAMAKGSKKIAFPNPLDGTMSIEAQVYPFKFFALLSDGVIETTAAYADKQTVTASEAGTLNLTIPSGGTIEAGTVFVYPEDEFGNEAELIEGTFATDTFTASTSGDIQSGASYTVGYIINRTGVKKISINNKKLPKDYYITQKTIDKDEDDNWTPFLMTAYRAAIKRDFNLSFSSEGDPATVTLNFDLLEDKDGNVFDMVELTEDAE